VAVITQIYDRQIPATLPTGSVLRLFVQAETSQSFDEDVIAYTIVPPTASQTGSSTLYLPLLEAKNRE
jgi:hypothetical protein